MCTRALSSLEGRSYEWTSFGRYEGRDGTILVRYGHTTLLEPSVLLEAAE